MKTEDSVPIVVESQQDFTEGSPRCHGNHGSAIALHGKMMQDTRPRPREVTLLLAGLPSPPADPRRRTACERRAAFRCITRYRPGG